MNKNSIVEKDEEEISLDGVPIFASIPEQDRVLPNPGLLEFYNDVRNRMIYIDQDIEESVAMEIQKLVIEWNREDKEIAVEQRRPIKAIIHSMGGSVSAMNNIIDVFMLSKTPIYTYNVGVAYSAGLDILLAGSKRFCFPKSQALVHIGSGVFQGTGVQITDASENYKRQIKKFEEWILARTKIDKATYTKKKKNEWYLDAEEQVKYGIVDSIVTSLDELL